jgi:hypothetical protein
MHIFCFYHVGETTVGAGVVRQQVDHEIFLPRAVGKTQIQSGNTNDPVWRGAQHADQRDFRVFLVHSKGGARVGVHVRVPQTGSLDNRPYVMSLKITNLYSSLHLLLKFYLGLIPSENGGGLTDFLKTAWAFHVHVGKS